MSKFLESFGIEYLCPCGYGRCSNVSVESYSEKTYRYDVSTAAELLKKQGIDNINHSLSGTHYQVKMKTTNNETTVTSKDGNTLIHVITPFCSFSWLRNVVGQIGNAILLSYCSISDFIRKFYWSENP